MFVHARVTGPELAGAIVVPRDAIVNGRMFAVSDDNTAEPREITVSRTLQSLAVVTGGIEHGDRVVLTNLDVLHEGAAVDVQRRTSLAQELQNQRTKVVRRKVAAAAERNPPAAGSVTCPDNDN